MKPSKKFVDTYLSESFLWHAFLIAAAILFALLFCYALLMTGKTEGDEYIHFYPDSIFMNALWICILLFVSMLVRMWGKGIKQKSGGRLKMNCIAIAVSAAVALISIYWIHASCVIPGADQEYVCIYAKELNAGIYDSLKRGGYVAIYKQQLGIITFLRLLFKLFGEGNFKAFQYFASIMSGVLCYSGYALTKRLSDDDHTSEIYYLIFIGLCAPLYAYAPWVYGEIPSTALLLAAACLLYDCMKKVRAWKLVLLGLLCGLAVQFRMNSLIVILGFLAAVVVKLISGRSKWIILTGVSVLAGVFILQGAVNLMYRDKIPEDSTSMPSILHIAMGTNYDRGFPGWYNWYNWLTFKEVNYDVAEAKKAGHQKIDEFVEKCRKDPSYARKFFTEKMLAQWEAPMFEALIMNNRINGEQSKLAKSIYWGKLNQPLENYMNIYQLMVYGGILFLLISSRRKWNQIEKSAVLIGIFGGFFFTLIWEAKTRYVLPYFLMMLPYAAVGVRQACTAISERIKKRADRKPPRKLNKIMRVITDY